MTFKTRKDMLKIYEETMHNVRDSLKETQQLEEELNVPKTYVLESNSTQITSIFDKNTIKKIEDNFYSLKLNKIVDKKSEPIEFFVDTTDNRFWSIYTFGKSKVSDRIIRSETGKVFSKLDHLWLSVGMLKEIQEKGGEDKGIGIKYNFGSVFGKGETEKMSMRVWGESEKIISGLSEKNLGHILAITSIRNKKQMDDLYITENLDYFGKFSSYGNDVSLHLNYIENVLGIYKLNLGLIEDNMLSYEKGNISGSVFSIIINKEMEDLDQFSNCLFSSKLPFRLWGLKSISNADMKSYVGIDLHNGDELSLEIYHSEIRVYIKKHSCGNTLLRLLENLQRHYDSSCYIEVPEYGRIK